MSITAASLMAKVSVEGVDTAKNMLQDMGKATNGLGDIFKNALGGALNILDAKDEACCSLTKCHLTRH